MSPTPVPTINANSVYHPFICACLFVSHGICTVYMHVHMNMNITWHLYLYM